MRIRRKPKLVPVSSPMLTLIVILSALLFVSLFLVSCRNEINAPPPPQVVDRGALTSTTATVPPMAVPPPPKPYPADMRKEAVAGGVGGYVVGGVAGGTIGVAPAQVAEFNTEEYGRFQEN